MMTNIRSATSSSSSSSIYSLLGCLFFSWIHVFASPAVSFLMTPARPHHHQQQIMPPQQTNYHSINAALHQVLPNDYYFSGGPNSDQHISQYNTSEFCTALAIVPLQADWDRIQRARHYARDAVFHEWPPAIRLFHPFSGNALELADAVEELGLEPFEITLDTWVIVPHMEALEAEWQTAQAAPSVVDHQESRTAHATEEEDRVVRELIAAEEKKAKAKNMARRKKTNRSEERVEEELYAANNTNVKKSPAQVLEEQKRQYEDFGGPCVLCLEPNPESKQYLTELRDALAEMLSHDTYSSPSSVYSWKFVDQLADMGYRPLVPVSSFESLQSALDVARRLKGVWGQPLTLTVKDLHVISCAEDHDDKYNEDYIEEDWSTPQSASEWNQIPWGCNAKVMLMGAELDQDEGANEKMIQQLVEQGNPGGMDISQDFTVLDDEEDATPSIEDWLNNDDDWDDGSEVVIGRTHFFTGEQRTYTGMPASSVVDAKDRSMGEGGQVSALARRRRTTSRQGALWEDGEYGRRENDYLPWSKKERRQKLAGSGLAENAIGGFSYPLEDDSNDDK